MNTVQVHRMEPIWSAPPEQADVVIIGGGLIGTAIAAHCASSDLRVSLLERHHLACGASGRNDGQIILETADYYQRMKQVYGENTARAIFELKRAGQDDLHSFLNDNQQPNLAYHRAGSLTLAINEQEAETIEAAVQEMRKDGFHTELVDANQIEKMIGTRRFEMGKFDALDSVVNPANLTRLFAKTAQSRGAQIVEDCPVFEINDGVIKHAYGQTKCEISIVATNAYTPQFIPKLSKHIFPIRGQVLATGPSNYRYQPIGCITNFGYEYWHWTPEGRLILGGKRPTDEHGETGYQEWTNPTVQNALDAFQKEMYPEFKGLHVERRWSGIMGFSSDGMPLVGPLSGDPTQWIAAGFTGYGLGMAWAIGKAVGQVLCGEDSLYTQAIQKFSPARMNC